jgi:hypothetical protein
MCVFGLLGLAAPSFATPSLCDATAGNLVLNCGFETGTFINWSHTGNTLADQVDAFVIHSGSYGADLGPVGAVHGFLSQTLATASGAIYDLRFYLESGGGSPADFTAYWNGNPVFSLANTGSFGYTLEDIPNLVGTGSDVLSFGFRQDPAFYGLDDISVVQTSAGASTVPEPATLALLGSGLVGTALRRRRGKA